MADKSPLETVGDLYEEHYRYLRHFLIGLTKNNETADDIIQELFSRILTNPESVLNVSYSKSWLIKGAKNTLLDHYKKKRPVLLEDERLIEQMLIDTNTPEVSLFVSEQLEAVLGKLSDTDKAIILAKEYYGYDYKEISDLLDIPVPTLKSKVFRMRKKLIQERSNEHDGA